MPVAITIHDKQLAKLQKALGHIKDGVPKALAGAINKTLNKGRTVVRREIRKEYVIKQKDIPIKVRTASRVHVSGEIRLEDSMLPLSKFEVRPRGMQKRKTKKLIHARVKKGGGGFIKSAFFIPRGGPYSRIGPDRHPIFLLRTISAPIMATQPNVGPAANEAMGKALDYNIDNQIVRIMAQAGGR